MPRKFFKHKLLLDEDVYLRNRLPILNSRFDVKHIASDLGYIGLTDEKVHALAAELGRIIVTFNRKDFKELASRSTHTGVIGLSANIPIDHIDKKLTALLMRSSKKILYGKLTTLTDETEVSQMRQ